VELAYGDPLHTIVNALAITPRADLGVIPVGLYEDGSTWFVSFEDMARLLEEAVEAMQASPWRAHPPAARIRYRVTPGSGVRTLVRRCW
jgi:hypothetical protein